MESNGITDDKAKIVFIGSHLKDNAWSWFEPFMRERDTKPEIEWSDRTTKVLKNYKELTKAMGQVFGDIDERKTAAVRLQKLRQVTSVRQYITEFQTITANLEWDEEALNDKFEEGLKPEIRKALIFYPREQKDLEELFERAQKLIEKCGTETIIMIASQQNPIAITAKIRRGTTTNRKIGQGSIGKAM